MPKYRKKPVIIEAFQFRIDHKGIPDWFKEACIQKVAVMGISECLIHTLEGTMKANLGDYIIKGVADEIYPCKLNIFEATYERVDGDDDE